MLLVSLCFAERSVAEDPSPPTATPAPEIRTPVSIASATTEQIQQSIERAIPYLQAESASWLSTRKCAACHHAPMPFWALAEADRAGYPIDKPYLTGKIETLLGSKDALLASGIFPNPAAPPDPRPQGRGLNIGLPMLAVAARAMPSLTDSQRESLQLITEQILEKQQPDGSWEFFDTLRRPPINETQTTDTAWIILALAGETTADSSEPQRAALAKAIAWLDAQPTSELHQDRALAILLAVQADKPRAAIKPLAAELLALQRLDGGWSQTIPEPVSDAFATGQTLYALALAGHTIDELPIRRGLAFLVATQQPDGAWPMASRSTPDGSPGSSKLLTPINCAAASWAVLGMSRVVGK
jgi:hypothetical protein